MNQSFTSCLMWCPISIRGQALIKTCLALLFLAASLPGFSQVAVTGNIKDENGTVLPGASVLEKGTTNGTTADSDGNYRITVGSGSSILVFSFIGYASQEFAVGDRTQINVNLQTDITALSEVVVVGYGAERKSDLTGSVSLVKTQEMTKLATNDITQMLQGRVAGVAVNSDGQPGAAPSVKIRGIATFGTRGTSAEPLYVVDGMPLQGGIRDFNPNDIESMQVLKDASAGAIYGSRAANGVIIITTKRGVKDRPLSIEVNSYYGVQNVAKTIPVTNRVQYQMLNNEMRANNATGPLPPLPGNDSNDARFIDDVDTDWQDAGFKTGVIQDYNVNFSGGGKSSSYGISLDYFKNTGTLVGNGPNYDRYTTRINSTTQKGILTVGESFFVMHSEEDPVYLLPEIPGGRPSYINDLVLATPTMPLYDQNRKGGFGGTDAVTQSSISLNVPGINTLVSNHIQVTRMFADTYGELALINKGGNKLTYKLNLAYDFTTARDKQFVPEYDLGYFFPNANARYSTGIRQYITSLIENTLNYEKTVGKHSIKVLVGQTYQAFNNYFLGGSTSRLKEPYIPTVINGEDKGLNEGTEKAILVSLLGRLNYSYDDRYLITANIRRDGSSRISPANRYEIFPSVAVAWKLHNEKFVTMPEFISELKVRGSWGKVGNQGIPNYAFQPTINQNIPYAFGNAAPVLGGATTIQVDPNLRWEIRTTRNVGVDGTLFDGKFDFTLEYYSNLASDILLDTPIPGSSGSLPNGTGGQSFILRNAAEMQNSGFEFSFTYRKQAGDFTFEISPNAYTLKNRVTKLAKDKDFLPGVGSRTEVGHEIGSHYGWIADGIFQTTDEVANHEVQNIATSPGDIRFRDLDDNDVIDDNDRTYLGKALPSLYYGLNFTAKYKDFDFTFFASGSSGNKINDNLYRALMSGNSYANYHEDLLGRWTPTNTNTDIPRMVLLDPNSNGRDSNRPGWLESGNYLRINTVSFGYTLPTGTIKGLTSARIYITCQNLYTFAAYKGFNPDFTAGLLNQGFDFGTYPKPRTFMLGAQLRF